MRDFIVVDYMGQAPIHCVLPVGLRCGLAAGLVARFGAKVKPLGAGLFEILEPCSLKKNEIVSLIDATHADRLPRGSVRPA